jgi:radical SAM superfamily enzyme YgiQ (UPF0313 family)
VTDPYRRDAAGKGPSPGEEEVWLDGYREGEGRLSDALTVAMCYPAGYSLGMSNLGFQTALRLFNEEPDVLCERAFLEPRARCSGSEGAALDLGAGPDVAPAAGAGATLESGRSLSEFDVVAFSVSFEDDYAGALSMLHSAGIPLESGQRSDADPVVVMGGVCAHLNPEPLAPLMDAVLVGEADALVPPLVRSLAATRGMSRDRRLLELARIEGAYVPRLYDVRRDDLGRVDSIEAADGAPFPVHPAAGEGLMAESVVLSPDAFFSDMFLVETSRGCARGCRFCAAGHAILPRRHNPAGAAVESFRRAREHTGRLGLVTAALLDHPDSLELLEAARTMGFEVNVSSMRADRIDAETAALLRECGVRTVTMAPETASEDLRRAIGKPMSDEVLSGAAAALAGAGMTTLRLYFMVGLPGETGDDVAAIPELARRLREEFVSGRSGTRVSVSVSAFVPKPRTPFQWLPMADEAYIRDALRVLRRELARRPAIEFSAAGPREARREGVLARGGRELAPVLVALAVDGVPWKAALRRSGVDPDAVVGRVRADDEVFPWDVVAVGPPRHELLASLAKAKELLSGMGRRDD